MRNLSVLIKPSSSSCNIDCKYCFYKDEDKLREKRNIQLMDIETMEVIVRKAFEFADGKIIFVFQGGEPTLMGITFYEKFIEFVNRYNENDTDTEFSIQTNGLLIDEKWCLFFKKHKFLVGISFDGTPRIHDIYRVNYEGVGTSHGVIYAIRNMQKLGVEYNVLMVITHDSVSSVRECYEFLKKLGVSYLQIIFALDPYGEGKCSQPYSISKKDLELFLISLFDIWYKDFVRNQEVRVTYFENIIYKMMGNAHSQCAMNGMCSIEMVIESDGNVYPCDFYVADQWNLGNLHETSFESILHSQTAAYFLEESIGIGNKCRTCEWSGLCQGACRRYQLCSDGQYENYYCDAYKAFFKHAHQRMLRIAKAISNNT